MGKRREMHEEHENHERWLVSYADFITLLFAFFVVMYAISSVNEGKYRVLSSTLEQAFQTPPTAEKPISVTLSEQVATAAVQSSPIPNAQTAKDSLESLVERLRSDLADSAQRGEVEIKYDGRRIEVSIKSQVLFASGSAVIAAASMPVLAKVADVVRESDTPVQIEGHTDNVPIVSALYPSNWELSAARAVSVLRLFEEQRVNPSRMAAVGYAEHQPVSDNLSEEGRSRNRRVMVIISRPGNVQQIQRDDVPTAEAGGAG